MEYIFRHTAFKHSLGEAYIRRAFETCRYMGQHGGRENVFHAMPCRSQFYRLFEEEETP